MITATDIQHLKDALAKSTPGQWRVYGAEDEYGGGVIVSTNISPETAHFNELVTNQDDQGDTVAWHEDNPPYTRAEGDESTNILGDSDLGVGANDAQTRANFEAIALMQNMLPDLIKLAEMTLETTNG